MSGTNPPKTIFARDATGLVKQISGMDALGMVVTQMGLLYVFNVVAFTPSFYPSANPIAVPLIGVLLILPIAGMYILFSIAIPRSGGDYVWVGRIFSPGIGFTTNFALTLLVVSIVAAVAPWIGQWSIAQMFYDLGVLQHNAGFISTANYLEQPGPTFWVSAGFIILAGLIVIASSRLAARVVKYWALISIVIGAVFIGTVLSSSSSHFAANFNALSGSNMTYDQVINAGQQQFGAFNGVPPVLSSATLYAGALGLLGYLGFNSSAYFSGEIRQNRKNQILAQFGGTILFAAFTSLMIAVMYFGEGPKFVNAMAALWYNGSGQYPYLAGSPPLSSGMSMFWTQNSVLIAIFTLSFGLTAFVMDVSIFYTFTRNLFAWSFDRVVPTAFANINSRTRTPVYAASLMTALGIVYTYIAIFQSNILTELFSYGTAGEFLVFLVVSLAAIVYPYRRRDIFASADPTSQRKIAGIPLITIFGVLSLGVSLLTLYSLLSPSIGGVDAVPVLLEGTLPTFIIGAVIYVIVWSIRKRQGVDLGMLQREIPPE